jgi:hypothetical protein
MNPGNVWWLVFAGRWDRRPGTARRLSPDEVAYATFVLTGKQVLPHSGTPIPRMTLADGQS